MFDVPARLSGRGKHCSLASCGLVRIWRNPREGRFVPGSEVFAASALPPFPRLSRPVGILECRLRRRGFQRRQNSRLLTPMAAEVAFAMYSRLGERHEDHHAIQQIERRSGSSVRLPLRKV